MASSSLPSPLSNAAPAQAGRAFGIVELDQASGTSKWRLISSATLAEALYDACLMDPENEQIRSSLLTPMPCYRRGPSRSGPRSECSFSCRENSAFPSGAVGSACRRSELRQMGSTAVRCAI
jgi:hypothetical protein